VPPVNDSAAHPLHPGRTLVSSSGSQSGVRWVLEEEPDGGVVLTPGMWSRAVAAGMASLYLAFGAGWTALLATIGHWWAAALGLPLMAAVTFCVLRFYRVAGRAEVERGPVLTWSPSRRTLSLPRQGLSVPRDRVDAFELYGRWERMSGRFFLSRRLDVVIRDDGARTTSRHTIVADATRLHRLGEELARRVGVRLLRIR
jgi:hypothetical protein